MYYTILPDTRELDKWLTEVEQRTVRQVAASSLTTLARMARTRSVRLIKIRMGLPSKQVTKRIRAWRAHPKRLRAGIIANQADIPEIVIGNPRQTGHPGRPRTSSSKAAVRQRKARKRKGAKAPRSGGVRTYGKGSIDGAWIGSTRKSGGRRGKSGGYTAQTADGSKNTHVRQRRRTRAKSIYRDWGPSIRTLKDQQTAATRAWDSVFTKRLKVALEKRGQTKAATFLADQGKL